MLADWPRRAQSLQLSGSQQRVVTRAAVSSALRAPSVKLLEGFGVAALS